MEVLTGGIGLQEEQALGLPSTSPNVKSPNVTSPTVVISLARGYAAYECSRLIILQGYEPLPFMSWTFTSWTQWIVDPIQRTYTNTNSQLRP